MAVVAARSLQRSCLQSALYHRTYKTPQIPEGLQIEPSLYGFTPAASLRSKDLLQFADGIVVV